MQNPWDGRDSNGIWYILKCAYLAFVQKINECINKLSIIISLKECQ